jgi:hypothetical protein
MLRPVVRSSGAVTHSTEGGGVGNKSSLHENGDRATHQASRNGKTDGEEDPYNLQGLAQVTNLGVFCPFSSTTTTRPWRSQSLRPVSRACDWFLMAGLNKWPVFPGDSDLKWLAPVKTKGRDGQAPSVWERNTNHLHTRIDVVGHGLSNDPAFTTELPIETDGDGWEGCMVLSPRHIPEEGHFVAGPKATVQVSFSSTGLVSFVCNLLFRHFATLSGVLGKASRQYDDNRSP